MKRTSLYILGTVIFCLSACKPCTNPPATAEMLMQTDKEFSELSHKEGMVKAFLKYADENVVKLEQHSYPIIGKTALATAMKEDTSKHTELTWSPVKGEISVSGDLGYTYGNWKFVQKDSGKLKEEYGNYVTIWKLQSDGSWKYVLDGGNTTPGPPH